MDEQRTALEAAATKLHLVDERHNVEVDSLQRALQVGFTHPVSRVIVDLQLVDIIYQNVST